MIAGDFSKRVESVTQDLRRAMTAERAEDIDAVLVARKALLDSQVAALREHDQQAIGATQVALAMTQDMLMRHMNRGRF